MARRTTFVSIGQRFGRLVCLDSQSKYPLWKCDCGTEKRIFIHGVVSGDTKSCGCLKREMFLKLKSIPRAGVRVRDTMYLGKRFGKLVVCGPVVGRSIELRCDCGSQKYMDLFNLARGTTKSCGCTRIENLSKRFLGRVDRHQDHAGKRFGRLVAMSRVGTSNCGAAMWLCKCDCGNTAVVRSSQFTGGIATSCGCFRDAQIGIRATKHGRYKERSYANALAAKRRAVKLAAFVEDVRPELVYERDMGLCGICGLPVEEDFNLDHRVPLCRGGTHSYENCQTAHRSCNYRKSKRLPENCAHLWMRS